LQLLELVSSSGSSAKSADSPLEGIGDAKLVLLRLGQVQRRGQAIEIPEFLSAGGTEEAFEAAWPGIRQEQLRKRSVDTAAEARDAQRGMSISSI